MRIFDKRRDYYDFYQEVDDISWVRSDSPEISKSDSEFIIKLFKAMPYPDCYCGRYTLKKILVGLAGKLYPYYSMEDYKSMNAFQDVSSLADELVRLKISFSDRYHGSIRRPYSFSKGGWDAYLKDIHSKRDRIYQIFINNSVALFRCNINGYSDPLIPTNPILQDYRFMSIRGPFEVYQDLKHFISNDLVKNPLTDFKLSDNLMRDSKGFDKHSFKKMGR